jgi:thioredoxin 1
MSEVIDILDEEQFSALLQSGLPLLVDFWAPWCAPCKALTPVLSAIAKRYTGQITFAKVNIDALPLIASRYSVRSIPYCVLFKGESQLGDLLGLQPPQAFMNFLKGHLATLRDPQ